MEGQLLETLHQKLRDLEQDLGAYRQHRVAGFVRFSHDLLRDVPAAAAASIQQAIAQSLPEYPTLRPELQLQLSRADPRTDSEPSVSPGSAPFQPSPPPAVPGDASAPSSPHDREKELQGLFTPSYLPLLESSPVPARAPPVAAATAVHAALALGISRPAEPVSPGQGAGQGVVDMDGPSDTGGAQGPSLTPQLPERPHHVRSSTEDTTSTAFSDRSDTKPARSALRRSSGSNKPPQSPRRVRFEFMGAEVLPTSSPQATDSVTPDPFSPVTETDAVTSDAILGVAGEEDRDDRPPPRKISSSDALRALSKTPLEGTVWTVVNSGADETASSSRNPQPPDSPSPSPREKIAPQPIAPQPTSTINMPESSRRQPLSSVHEEPEADMDDSDSSDEEFLAMGKPKSSTSKKPIISPTPRSPTLAASSGRVLKERPGSQLPEKDKAQFASHGPEADDDEDEVDDDEDDDDDEDELFHFEETGGLTAPPKPRPRPPPKKDPVEDESDTLPDDAAEFQSAAYATSPAVTIAARPQAPEGPPTPTTAKFQAGSLGSYKGRPVVMPVVRNPEVHAQAASLGQFNTFVGSVDGRSGMDEGNFSSFRASVPSGFSGTPRSFTERFMMEEAAANMENNGGNETPQ